MGDVERGQDAPEPVDLRVVLVDFGEDPEYGRKGNGDGKAGDEWIGLEVNIFEALMGLEDAQELRRQLIELREVWVDCLGPVDTVREGLQYREHHRGYQLRLLRLMRIGGFLVSGRGRVYLWI
jgi:hypothetical protein